MATAARPVSGEPIASTWGGQVHDVAVKARYCTASSGATAVSVQANFATLVGGEAAMLSGGRVVIPVAGLWEIFLNVHVTGAAGMAARVDITKAGAGLASGMGHGTVTPASNNQHSGSIVAREVLAAGDQLGAQYSTQGSGGSGPSCLFTLSARLVAQE